MSDSVYFSFERTVEDSVSIHADDENHRVIVNVVRFDNVTGEHTRSRFSMTPDEAMAFANGVSSIAELVRIAMEGESEAAS